MGSNFVTECFWYRKGDTLEFKAGHKIIDDLSAKNIKQINSYIGHIKNSKNHLHSCLEQIENLFTGNTCNAEYTEYEFLPYTIYITGGDSWGNDPTEFFTCIRNLNTADENILKACGLNKDIIDYREILMKILSTKEIIPLLIGIDKNLDTLIETEILKPHGKKSSRRKR